MPVDPVGSLYYDYFKTGRMTEAFSYIVEGIGEDFMPSTIDFALIDDVVRVNDKECMITTRRLAREEGIFAGGSCGAAVAGALKWVKANDREGMNVVILLPDSGSRYLSKIYNDQWMSDNGFLDAEQGLGVVADVLETVGPRAPITAPHTLPATEAVALLRTHGISQIPVLDGTKILGTLHERHLLDAAIQKKDMTRPVSELCTPDFCTVDRSTEVSVLSNLLRKAHIALVMDGGRIEAVLTRIDVIAHVSAKTARS